jgi:acyl-coenzyme A thioesterase PaaI-like protein
MCDIALGKTIERFSTPPTSGLTLNFSIDYLSTAKVGDWLEARVDYWRAGKTVANGNVYVRNGATIIARANATFAVVERG